jgi:colicin import membrane protein
MNTIGAVITIILVVGWIIRGLSSVVGNDEQTGTKRPTRSLEEWDEMQAKRRAQMAERQDALSELRAESGAQDPSQMTMAQRIELARERARQQAGLGQDGDREEALARRRAEEQAQQRREAQQRQQAERERVQRARREREREQQRRRRRAEQEAEEKSRSRRQRTSKQQRQQATSTRATTGSQREAAVSRAARRAQQKRAQPGPTLAQSSDTQGVGITAAGIGKLDRRALRQAFIMKEVLDKPVALRDPQAELPS